MKLQKWTDAQETAFQVFLKHYADIGRPVPQLLINPFRKGFRDREYTPSEIAKHRGLLPPKTSRTSAI